MRETTNAFMAGLTAGMIAGAVIAGLAAGFTVQATYQRRAIERHAAEHDRVTGKWQWIEKEGSKGR